MVLNKLFWNNKKILLTGHTGFKGFWLGMLLNILDAEVAGLSIDKTFSWYLTYYQDKSNIFDFTKNQIINFQEI